MGTEDFTTKFQGLKITENQDINILLLGETGVGKSTFINAIANYLHYKSFKKASKRELLILIPALITVTNENLEQVTIQAGSDNNEFQEVGAAGTQDVKTYVFPIGEGKTRLRLIDSPGMGDPRGIVQDDVNCENILAYLSQLKELHAICFLMRPTNTRKTIFFEYCVKEILSRLEKSASKNITFIFTNTRGTDYTPGETLPCLRDIIRGIKANPPHCEIPLSPDNTFSLDNEAFRYFVALKREVKFSDDIRQRFIESWTNSSNECWRFIKYIVGDVSHDGLKPHQLYNTISINEARKIIGRLCQPMADITQLIYDNIRILDKHTHNLKMDNQSLDELKKKMYVPIVSLEVTQLTQPVTVCTSPKCARLVNVGEVKKWHYHQRCHDPCYLTNVTREIVGDANLMQCAAMHGTRTCTKCTCDYSLHMHIYYMTKTVDDRIVDDVVRNNIHQKEAALREIGKLMGKINERKTELERERDVIITSTAQFAHFLQHNAIAPFNDSYKTYIEYLIKREQSLGNHSDQEVIRNLELLLARYNEIKAAFDHGLKLNQQFGLNTHVPSSVSAESIMTTIKQLYQLKHNGKKIHELLEKQKTSRSSEYDKNCEYIHPQTTGFQDKAAKQKKKKSGYATDGPKQDKLKGDKKKSSKTTDDEAADKNINPRYFRQSSGPQNNTHYRSRSRPRNPSSSQVHEPPPPYPGHSSGPRYNSGRVQPTTANDENPNFVLKVEFAGNQRNNSENFSPHGPPSNVPYPEPRPYHVPPQNPYDGNYQGQAQYWASPQQDYYGSQGQYRGPPPQGQYPGPSPQGQYQGPPPQGQYQRPPPQGQYHVPPQRGQYQRPAKDRYYGQGYYSEPSSENYYGQPRRQHQDAFPPQDQHHRPGQGYRPSENYQNRGARGRPFYVHRGRGGPRGKSNTYTEKVKKSEKQLSSSSESSSD